MAQHPNPKRMSVWRHNALQGHVALSKAGMKAIYDSPTTTLHAKRLAAEIQEKLHYLAEHVKIRVDQ